MESQPLLNKMFNRKTKEKKEEIIRLESCLQNPQVSLTLLGHNPLKNYKLMKKYRLLLRKNPLFPTKSFDFIFYKKL